jgi:hypothetical protein
MKESGVSIMVVAFPGKQWVYRGFRRAGALGRLPSDPTIAGCLQIETVAQGSMRAVQHQLRARMDRA